jgi:hypothetical protein
MKKITLLVLSLVILAGVAAIIIVTFSSPDDDKMERPLLPHLSSDVEIKIKQDFLDFYTKTENPDATVDDVSILFYYGTYGGCVAVKMTDRFSVYYQVITIETIDGIKISTNDSNPIHVWKDENFYSLQEAYDEGYLTKDNLREIALFNVAY